MFLQISAERFTHLHPRIGARRHGAGGYVGDQRGVSGITFLIIFRGPVHLILNEVDLLQHVGVEADPHVDQLIHAVAHAAVFLHRAGHGLICAAGIVQAIAVLHPAAGCPLGNSMLIDNARVVILVSCAHRAGGKHSAPDFRVRVQEIVVPDVGVGVVVDVRPGHDNRAIEQIAAHHVDAKDQRDLGGGALRRCRQVAAAVRRFNRHHCPRHLDGNRACGNRSCRQTGDGQ